MVFRISLFGLPGAGKGTQALKLACTLGLPHISAGDILRSLPKNEVDKYVTQGQLVPDDLVTKIVFQRLSKDDCQSGFILDGFPRTITQAKSLMISPYRVTQVINIEVSRETIIKRISGRRICVSCGSIYNISEFLRTETAKCKKDGLSLIQRKDDLPEAIKTRLDVFEENFLPIIKYVSDQGILINLSGEGSEDIVFERILRAIGYPR